MKLSWREFQQYLHSPPASGVLQLRLYFLENSESYRSAFSWGGLKIALSAGQTHWRRYWTFWIRFLSEYFLRVCLYTAQPTATSNDSSSKKNNCRKVSSQHSSPQRRMTSQRPTNEHRSFRIERLLSFARCLLLIAKMNMKLLLWEFVYERNTNTRKGTSREGLACKILTVPNHFNVGWWCDVPTRSTIL